MPPKGNREAVSKNNKRDKNIKNFQSEMNDSMSSVSKKTVDECSVFSPVGLYGGGKKRKRIRKKQDIPNNCALDSTADVTVSRQGENLKKKLELKVTFTIIYYIPNPKYENKLYNS
jgi:hypothetical protein